VIKGNAGYDFFLQCWLSLSPYKTPKKAFNYLDIQHNSQLHFNPFILFDFRRTCFCTHGLRKFIGRSHPVEDVVFL
jgi:hypothetical protein